MTRILIVDDQELIRAGLATIINAHPDLEVIAESASGESAVIVAATEAVDVVLMDLHMPGMGGVEATRKIRAAHPDINILVLTTFDQDENVLAALRAGAAGFLSKGSGPTELTTAILDIAAGRRALSATALEALVTHVSDTPHHEPDPQAVQALQLLTPRELEMVRHVVSGLTNAEIAQHLYVSPLTVKTHINRAMSKLGARDRAQLVTIAVQSGIQP